MKPAYTWTLNCDPSKPDSDRLIIEKMSDGTARLTIDNGDGAPLPNVTLTPQAFQWLRTHLYTEEKEPPKELPTYELWIRVDDSIGNWLVCNTADMLAYALHYGHPREDGEWVTLQELLSIHPASVPLQWDQVKFRITKR